MNKREQYKTWGKNRSVRLAGHDYREHFPYHIVIHAIAGASPFANHELARTTCNELRSLAESRQFYLATYCLLPDHLHVLLSPADSGLSVGEFIGQFKGRTTNQSWKLGWRGKLWQPRFYDHIVRASEGVPQTARYILENPFRAGLGENYPFRWRDPALAI